MASSGKPRTTRAKLQREATLRERRFEKAARKEIRKQAQLDPEQPYETDPFSEAESDTEDGVRDAPSAAPEDEDGIADASVAAPDDEDGIADASVAAPEAEANVGP